MQVNFTGVLKAYIPGENATQVPIKDRFKKAKDFENVLNNKSNGTEVYSQSERMKLALLLKKTVTDYRIPDKNKGDEYNRQAGICRVIAADGIYYCTGVDAELAREMNKRNKANSLSTVECMIETTKFVKEREQESGSGFVMLDSQDGKRYDIFGLGETLKGKNFNVDFLTLKNKSL